MEYEEGTRRYKTTEKGIGMEQVYNQINDALVISPTGQLQKVDFSGLIHMLHRLL